MDISIWEITTSTLVPCSLLVFNRCSLTGTHQPHATVGSGYIYSLLKAFMSLAMLSEERRPWSKITCVLSPCTGFPVVWSWTVTKTSPHSAQWVKWGWHQDLRHRVVVKFKACEGMKYYLAYSKCLISIHYSCVNTDENL